MYLTPTAGMIPEASTPQHMFDTWASSAFTKTVSCSYSSTIHLANFKSCHNRVLYVLYDIICTFMGLFENRVPFKSTQGSSFSQLNRHVGSIQ